MAQKNKTKTAASQANMIASNITSLPWNRQRQDITNWRNATRSAESQIPIRVYLYDLYNDVVTTDAQVIAVWGKRQDAVTTANWEFTDIEGEPVQEINDLIDCIGFENLLKEIMESKSWGYTMCEAEFFINDNDKNEFIHKSIPRKHMRPEKGQIVLNQQDQDGIDINQGYYAKTVMQFGNTKDLGLLLSASMYSIYKRGDIADWAEFIEIFGRGIVDAQWDGHDEGQRQGLVKAIRELGGGGVIIRPDGTKLDIYNNTGTANGQLQDTFASKMDGYISKALLGTTETTDSSKSSGYAQAETHNKQDEKKNESDLQYVRRCLNSQFIKVLKAAGFDTKGGTFVLKQDQNLDKSAFDIHAKMRAMGIPIDDDFFYENYGVRKPDNYDELKKEHESALSRDLQDIEENPNAPTPEVSEVENDDTPSKPTKKSSDTPGSGDQPNRKQLSWLARLLQLFHPAPIANQDTLIGASKVSCCGDPHTSIKLADSGTQDVNSMLLADQAWKAGGTAHLYPAIFSANAKTLISAFELGWQSEGVQLSSMGFDYNFTDPKIQTAWEMNLFKFSAVKAAYQSAQVNALFRKTNSFEEFYRGVKKMYGVENKNHLRTEYVTANAAGESASRYFRLRDQVNTFPYWRYKTQRDDKVRKNHAVLHDCVFKWDDQIWNYIMPPNGWNCRCYIVPLTAAEVTEEMLKSSQGIVDEFYNSEGWQAFENSGFATNMASTKEVFSASNQYSQTPDKVLENVAQMYYDDWGLRNIRSMQFDAKSNFKEAKENTFNEFWEKNKISNRKGLLYDYANRDINIDKSRITSHLNPLKEQYNERYKFLPAIEEVLKKPDEVWINNETAKQFDNYVYIKFYKNVIIKVVCRLDQSGNLTLVSWHDAIIDHQDSNDKRKNGLYRHRRGLIIKR